MDEKTKKVVEFLRGEYSCYESDASPSERLWLFEQIREDMCGDDEYTDEELTAIVWAYADGKYEELD